MELAEIKNWCLNDKGFVPIEGYKNLFGIQIFKSGRKHIKEEHVYYCYTPNNFDYSVYKNFVSEKKDYEKSKGYEFRKTYNLLRYEMFGNLCLYQLCEQSRDVKYNFTKFGDLKEYWNE